MPTFTVTRSIEIDAPVEQVFGFISDPRRRMSAMWLSRTGYSTGEEAFGTFTGTFQGWALYQTDFRTADQVRPACQGEFEWRARPASGPDVDYPDGAGDEYPDDWPRLPLTYHN